MATYLVTLDKPSYTVDICPYTGETIRISKPYTEALVYANNLEHMISKVENQLYKGTEVLRVQQIQL